MEHDPSSEGQIEEMLVELKGLGWVYNEDPEIQEEWYDAEMEAEVSSNREEAARHLQEFLYKVKAIAEKRKEV